jgi:hypothetical protein
MTFKIKATVVSALAALSILPATSHAVDGVSIEAGTGNSTQLVRFGAQWNWGTPLLQFGSTHLSGYWDASIAQWRGNRYQNTDATQNITDIGFTPVFRFEGNSKKGPYFEGGIGAHLQSHLYDNAGRKLSTAFEFGDHIGFGYVFQNNFDLGIRLQHFSNGGIKHPNNGVNFAVVRAAYQF